jgi:hypothetical protein
MLNFGGASATATTPPHKVSLYVLQLSADNQGCTQDGNGC